MLSNQNYRDNYDRLKRGDSKGCVNCQYARSCLLKKASKYIVSCSSWTRSWSEEVRHD
jgi:hypothetical protein